MGQTLRAKYVGLEDLPQNFCFAAKNAKRDVKKPEIPGLHGFPPVLSHGSSRLMASHGSRTCCCPHCAGPAGLVSGEQPGPARSAFAGAKWQVAPAPVAEAFRSPSEGSG